ncbi:hypothetical protein, partial [Mesorhizobium sp. GR13]|uniref:hypothetical protein n=1 Tax=Mesorhizobium sp. GR13 TaxID=2562308 RepID=UPI0019819471
MFACIGAIERKSLDDFSVEVFAMPIALTPLVALILHNWGSDMAMRSFPRCAAASWQHHQNRLITMCELLGLTPYSDLPP